MRGETTEGSESLETEGLEHRAKEVKVCLVGSGERGVGLWMLVSGERKAT